MTNSAMARRRFLQLAALTAAAGTVAACSGTKPTSSAAPTSVAQPAPSAAPQASAAQPTPTTAPIIVQQAQPTAAPTTAATQTTTKYNEAPMLADLVKAGKLPPIDQRLPESPKVITPLEEVGQYGGIWHRAYTGLSDRWGPTKLVEETLMKFESPDVNTIQVTPTVVEKWQQNSDATQYTFYFRKGMKWSDGQPITTDDVKFWWDDIQGNSSLAPVPSFLYKQQTAPGKYASAKLDVIDQYTVKVTYPKPFPLLPIQTAKNGGGMPGESGLLAPAHYLKQFLPKYGDMNKINALVKQKGLSSWTDLWGKAGDFQGPIAFWMLNPDVPVLGAWMIKDPPPKEPMVMVRNPYYYQVDTKGNQLPYIDQINHSLYQNVEVFKLWIAQGKIDCQMRGLDAGMLPYLEQNAKKGNYRVLNWRQAETDCYYVNLNCPDPVLAKLFQNPDFRQAMNVAVNRDKINQIVWNGLGTPRQYSPIKGSPEYDPEMPKVWSEYNPTLANQLLDKMGLKKGPNGVRLRPDGKPLEIVMHTTALQGSPGADADTLIVKDWAAVGVKMIPKFVERGLYEQLVHNANVQATSGFGWDRSSVVEADPGRFLGTIDDGPWAPAWGHWYSKSPYKQEQPPADAPIRKIWSLWDQTQIEPDATKRHSLFMQLLGIHKASPFAIGVVGEKPVPTVVKNNFINIKAGFIDDDTTRDLGLVHPPQFSFKK